MNWHPDDVWLELSLSTNNANLAPFTRCTTLGIEQKFGQVVSRVEFNLTAYIRHVIGPRSINGF